jgi:presenilin-like A22 family membrane protease
LGEQSDEKFHARAIYVVPVLASILFGLLCGSLLQKPTPSAPPQYPVTPFPQTGSDGAASASVSLTNALYFLVIIAVGATLIFLLIRYRGKRTLIFLTGFALTAAFGLLSMVYFSELLSSVPNNLWILLTITGIIVVLGDLAIFKFGGKISNIVVLGLGGALGAFLGANLNFPTALAILAVIAVYDVFAVYKGPVGKIATEGMDQLRGLAFGFKDIQMGLGDLVFYSLLAGNLFINYSLAAGLISVIGILVGSYLTFKVLERRDVFPGLPIPIALGIVLGYLATLFL